MEKKKGKKKMEKNLKKRREEEKSKLSFEHKLQIKVLSECTIGFKA